MSKEWPEDDTEIVAYSDLIEPVVDALNFAYDLERKNDGEDIPYEGWPHTEVAGMPPVEHLLTAEQLRYDEKENKRPPYRRILNVAFLLGMENGRRSERFYTRGRARQERLHLEMGLEGKERRINRLEERLCEALGYSDADDLYEHEPDLLLSLEGEPLELSEETKQTLKDLWKEA